MCLSKTSKCLSGWELYFLSELSSDAIVLTTLLGSLSSMFRSLAVLESMRSSWPLVVFHTRAVWSWAGGADALAKEKPGRAFET